MLHVAMAIISIVLVLEPVVPATLGQDQCDIWITTVYLPQFHLGTNIMMNLNRKDELLCRLATVCPGWGSNPNPQIHS